MNGDFEKAKNANAICYAWYIWVKGYSGDTVVKELSTVFVKCGKAGNQKTFDCIGYDGSIVHHCRDNNKLEIVGHMAEYDAFVDALRKLDRREKRE